MAAMDEVVDILERQMVRYKNRLNDKAKRSASFADELHAIALADDNYDDEEVKSSIVRTKHIPVKPMDQKKPLWKWKCLVTISLYLLMLILKTLVLYTREKMAIML